MFPSLTTYLRHPLAAPEAARIGHAIEAACDGANTTQLMGQIHILRDKPVVQELVADFLTDQLAGVLAQGKVDFFFAASEVISPLANAGTIVAQAACDGLNFYIQDHDQIDTEVARKLLLASNARPALRKAGGDELAASLGEVILEQLTINTALGIFEECRQAGMDMAPLAASIVSTIDQSDDLELCYQLYKATAASPALMASLPPSCTTDMMTYLLEAEDDTTSYLGNLAARVKDYPTHAHALANHPDAQSVVYFSTEEMGIGYPMTVVVADEPRIFVGCRTNDYADDRIEAWLGHRDDTRREHGIPKIFEALATLTTRRDPDVALAADETLREITKTYHNEWESELPPAAREKINATLQTAGLMPRPF